MRTPARTMRGTAQCLQNVKRKIADAHSKRFQFHGGALGTESRLVSTETTVVSCANDPLLLFQQDLAYDESGIRFRASPQLCHIQTRTWFTIGVTSHLEVIIDCKRIIGGIGGASITTGR